MVTINGVENTVEPGRPVSVINGGKFNRYNGIRPHEYDKWRMVWNGNHFAPPPAGAVLYYPGVPGQGTVIQDFAESYSDSGIDTDEVLDATETGVDCDADATTAIPVGTVILVESEKMFVTATGTTLTVARGYNGTVATTHATNIDIWKWIPNNGTLVGATWVRRGSGLWGLYYNGNNYVTLPVVVSSPMWQGAADFTIYGWAKTTAFTILSQVILGLGQNVDDFSYGFTGLRTITSGVARNRLFFAVRDATNQANFRMITDNAINLVDDTLYFFGVIQTGGVITFNINGVANAGINDLVGARNGVSFANTNTVLGSRGTQGPIWDQKLTGEEYIINVNPAALSVNTLLGIYQRERHLLGI